VKSDRIFLVGLSGSGKSTTGAELARRLGWVFVDADREIERQDGRPVTRIFAEEGESRFRELEASVLRDLGGRSGVVIATGGGAPTTPGGRDAIGRGFSVWLDVSPGVACRRLSVDPHAEERPLLKGNPEARLATMLADRRPCYARSDARVDVDALDASAVADAIVGLHADSAGLAATVTTSSSRYPVIVENGALDRLGEIAARVGLKGRAFILSDGLMDSVYSQRAAASLHTGGFAASVMSVPGGEAHKTLFEAGRAYEWLVEHRAERGDFIVCVGGGVVTDLGGFVAATYLRGVPFIHVPTSLLAMVDAAIGGKTGVDLPAAKNMVGAFAQPSAVVIDPTVLDTLPERHLRNGWAEVVKHGLILDADLLTDLEAVAGDPSAMKSVDLIARSVAIKATVVSDDEREADRRTLLNYGHTIGHAIEAVTGYQTYLHGEAISVGMHVAGRLSVALGRMAPSELDRQQAILRCCGLPEAAVDVSLDAVLAATSHDKKVSGGRIRWVLLDGIGAAVIHGPIAEGTVREAASPLFA
jgi:3-dehydroquinate synthase